VLKLAKEKIMVNLTRFNPNNDVLDDMFRGFFMRPVRFEDQPDIQIKMDVKEDDKNYTVSAEIPGVKKDDIHVTIDGDMVSISAEVKTQKEEKKDDKVLRSERYYGKVSRSFTLAQNVDEAGAQAKYTDGVLELTLPKRTGGQARRLNIM
jgi:HSP20 family protein